MKQKIITIIFLTALMTINPLLVYAQGESEEQELAQDFSDYIIFDDLKYLDGYAQKYSKLEKEIILEIIKDDTVSPYKTAGAVRVFNQNFTNEVVSKEKKKVEKMYIRRMNKSDSAFVQVEIMHGLVLMDRYKYFKSMVPALIKKLNHYNEAVNVRAFSGLLEITSAGNNRAREARIVFNTLRKILFLTRKRLAEVQDPDERLSQKLQLLRWSIKILGTEELKKLPKEVINLL